MSNLSQVIRVDRVLREGEMPWDYLLKQPQDRLPTTNELKEGRSVSVSIDLLEALKALREDYRNASLPPSLESLDITTTLYAAAKAQRGLSDAESYSPERAKEILISQDYANIDFYVCRKRPVCLNGKWKQEYIVDGRVSDSMGVNSRKENFQTIFDIFEEINRHVDVWNLPREKLLYIPEEINRHVDVWNLPREKLLYIPEEMVLCFGGRDLKTASVYFFASDDRCLDELPIIKVNKMQAEALVFLLGARFKEINGKYYVFE